MIPQSIKDAIDEYRIAIFDSSTPSHARKRLEDAIVKTIEQARDDGFRRGNLEAA